MTSLRPARHEDLPACSQIMVEALNDLKVRVGQPATYTVEQAWRPLWWAHLLASSAGFWVAEEGATVVAFGNCWRRESEWFLSHLFVSPRSQRGGVGKQLLARCWQSATDVPVRALVADTANIVSVSLYARYGMGPQVPLFNFSRQLADLSAPQEVPQVKLTEVDDNDYSWLEPFDRTIRGHARPIDHHYFRRAGHMLHRCTAGEITVGYVYVAPWGQIGPAVAGPKSLTNVVAAAVYQLKAAGCLQASLKVPGPATDVAAWLLRQGFQHAGLDVYCTDILRGDWRCYVPYNAGLP